MLLARVVLSLIYGVLSHQEVVFQLYNNLHFHRLVG